MRVIIQSMFLCVLVLLLGSSEAQMIAELGFEAGGEEWSIQKEGGAEGTVAATDKDFHAGKQSLLIQHTNDLGYIHPNKSVDIERGDYVLQFWAKSDADIRFVAQVYNAKDWNTISNESCNLKKGEWVEFKVPFSALESFPGSIQIGLTTSGSLWLDDVKLTKLTDSRITEDISLWDTVSPFISLEDRPVWRQIPKDSPSAPAGDLVLENGHIIAVFSSQEGQIIIHTKSGERKVSLSPLNPGKIASCRTQPESEGRVAVSAKFSENSTPTVFTFDRDPIIKIEAEGGMRVQCPMQFALLPNFISDDLVYGPADFSDAYVPSENLLLGLLKGEDSMAFITWPDEDQKVKLVAKDDGELFDFVELGNGAFSLALLQAPGIWHREELKPSYLEKSIAIDWKRPFPAKWITQLYEDNVKTTFAFKESEPKDKGFWRAGVGYYTYPVWFSNGQAVLHMGKKIPPKGESIIYSLERMGTPASVLTPVDVMKRTLDDQTCQRLLDPEGRRTRSLTRPNCAVGTATCEVTDKLKIVFEAGKEKEMIEYVRGGAEDMVYFLTEERRRALEYQAFARDMLGYLETTKRENPDLKAYLDEMEAITQGIINSYERAKDNVKELDYARELAVETANLAMQDGSQKLDAYMKLKREWTGMGGAIDDVNRILHTNTRKLFQQAGYDCAKQESAVKIAQEIRSRTVSCLRRPGHYETWSNY